MTESVHYAPLRQLSVLMTLDAVLASLEAAIFLMNLLLHLSIRSSAVLVYILWTMWSARMLSWVLTMAALSRLAGLRPSFPKAEIWYLLRCLIFVLTPLSISVVNYLYQSTPANSGHLTETVIYICDLGLCLLSETLFLPEGNRRILSSCAELLDAIGLGDQARKMRRFGKRLLGCAVLLTLLLTAALALTAENWFANQTFLTAAKATGGVPTVMTLLGRPPVLYVSPALLCVMALRFRAAALVGRTNRAAEDLAK